MSGMSWPVEGTVAQDDLAALAASGTETTIVSSGNTSAVRTPPSPPSERIGDQHVLVADQGASALLRDAATAKDEQTWSTDMAELTATLATAARSGTATSPVLLTLGREWPTDSDRLSRALDALESTAWVSPSDLSSAAAASAGSLTRRPRPPATTASTSCADSSTGSATSCRSPPPLDDPPTSPPRHGLSLLALSSNAWRGDTGDLTVAIDRQLSRWTKQTSAVSIPNSSSLTLLGDRSSLPISVRNRSDYP